MSDSDNATFSTLQAQDAANIGNMCTAIDSIAEDLKQKLQVDNEQLVFCVEKFISHYNKLKHSLPLLTSACTASLWLDIWWVSKKQKVATCSMANE